MKHEKSRHEEIHLGTHGEDYGSWMSNPVFYMIGGLLAYLLCWRCCPSQCSGCHG